MFVRIPFPIFPACTPRSAAFLQIAAQIFHGNLQQPLSGFLRCPCHMRCKYAVLHTTQRAICCHWLLLQHIQAGTGDRSLLQSLCQICLPYYATTCRIDQQRCWFHACKCLPVDESCTFRIQRTVQRYNIRLPKQLFQ